VQAPVPVVHDDLAGPVFAGQRRYVVEGFVPFIVTVEFASTPVAGPGAVLALEHAQQERHRRQFRLAGGCPGRAKPLWSSQLVVPRRESWVAAGFEVSLVAEVAAVERVGRGADG
jgi:hypothetical protein